MPKARPIDRPHSSTVKVEVRTEADRKAARARSLANLVPILKGSPSLNPGGKPKVLQEILSMGYKNTPQIMARLIDAALHNDDPAVWIAASREVLNRTFGKPSQQVNVDVEARLQSFVLVAPAVIDDAQAWEQEAVKVIEHHTPRSDDTAVLLGEENASNDINGLEPPKE